MKNNTAQDFLDEVPLYDNGKLGNVYSYGDVIEVMCKYAEWFSTACMEEMYESHKYHFRKAFEKTLEDTYNKQKKLLRNES